MADNETVHDFLHRLWSKAVGTSDYVKAEWIALDRAILDLTKDLEVCLRCQKPFSNFRKRSTADTRFCKPCKNGT